MLVDGGKGGITEGLGNLFKARSVAVLLDEIMDEVQNLFLTLREGHDPFLLRLDPNKNRI
jgi:hypothetical protein